MANKKKAGKPPVTQVTIIFAVLIIAVVAYYCYLVNRHSGGNDDVKLTYVENVLIRNLDKNYPPTVKEVVKYYNDIMKGFYNEDCTEEEIEDLARKARELYDEQLLQENPWDVYIFNLKNEIQDFKNNKRIISSFSVAASTDVYFFEEDGYSFARIRSGYNVLQGKDSYPTMLVYVLRKDDKGHWKIYGWGKPDEDK